MTAPTSITLPQLYRQLNDHLDTNGWWPAINDWQIIWGAVLIQNTNWKNVDYALASLATATDFEPAQIRQLAAPDLEQIIRSAGFYVRKAQTILNLCQFFAQYDDDLARLRLLPRADLRRQLLALTGVGHETADTIMLYVLSKETFIVDVYARRLFGRLGCALPRQYDAAQQLILPAVQHLTLRGLQQLHAGIVLFGQDVKSDDAWQASFLANYRLQLTADSQQAGQIKQQSPNEQ